MPRILTNKWLVYDVRQDKKLKSFKLKRDAEKYAKKVRKISVSDWFLELGTNIWVKENI